MTQIPILLLAAGQSSRMRGADKLMQDVDGMPLLRRSALIALGAGPVIVALRDQPHPRYNALEGLNIQLVPIPNADEGMNASLRGAMRAVPPQAPAVMILLADLPEITLPDLRVMIQAVHDNPDHVIWRGTSATGKPGHPVIFDRSLFDDLSALRGDDGAQSIVRANADRVFLQLLPAKNALLDLDTPEDWDVWRATRKG